MGVGVEVRVWVLVWVWVWALAWAWVFMAHGLPSDTSSWNKFVMGVVTMLELGQPTIMHKVGVGVTGWVWAWVICLSYDISSLKLVLPSNATITGAYHVCCGQGM